MFTHQCELCGRQFESASNRAKYCILCRDKAQAARNRSYIEKKKAGTSVAVGSQQKCPVCGKDFTVRSGSQKYCKDCMKKQQQASKGRPSAEYIKEKYDYIRFHVPKGEGDAIKEYARQHGMTIKQLLLSALSEFMERHRE